MLSPEGPLQLPYFEEKHIEFLLLSAVVMTIILSACGKEPAPSSQFPAQASPQAAPAVAKTTETVGEPSKEEKQKTMEAAKAAAKSAGKGK